MRRLFPEFDERAVELARIDALPTGERAAYLASRLGVFDGAITSEDAERWSAYRPAMAEELGPGRGVCTITDDEVDEAIRGLTSPHAIIRRHAVDVLGDRSLGVAVARRVLPLLRRTVQQDVDPFC